MFIHRLLTFSVLGVAACASPVNSGGGSSGLQTVGGACGSAGSQTCSVASAAAVRLTCAADGKWTLLEICAANASCHVDGAATTCVATAVGADAGSTDGATGSDAPLGDGGPIGSDGKVGDAPIGVDGIPWGDGIAAKDGVVSNDGIILSDSVSNKDTFGDMTTSKDSIKSDTTLPPGCGDLICSPNEQCKVDCSKMIQGFAPCIEQNCLANWKACVNDPNCIGLYNCMFACNAQDQKCLEQCYMQFDPKDPVMEPFGKCMDQNCKNYWKPVCGDGECSFDEKNCALDCPAVCGDGKCADGEAATCPNDCSSPGGCGDGNCDANENPMSCPPDCGFCGDGFCFGNETPASCPGDCGTGQCGDGKCDGMENFKTCPQDCVKCGDGICMEPFEDANSCAPDCLVCGDGACSAPFENANNCPGDCGALVQGCDAVDKQVLAKIKSDPNSAKLFQTSNQKCVLSSGCLAKPTPADQVKCVAACLQTITGLSLGCASCYGESDICMVNKCVADCAMDPASNACGQCIDVKCKPALDACVGP